MELPVHLPEPDKPIIFNFYPTPSLVSIPDNPRFSLGWYRNRKVRNVLKYGESLDDLMPDFRYFCSHFPQFRFDIIPVLF